jgi:hypothetical protein
VGLNEASDISAIGAFRLPGVWAFEGGKWFAATFEDALRWGRAMQRFTMPQPFRIAALMIPSPMLDDIEFHPRWDGIGPAYYIRTDQLTMVNRGGVVTVFDTVYQPE